MEHLTVTWTRPDGEEAVVIQLSYPTPQRASAAVDHLLAHLNHATLRRRQAVKETMRGMEG